MKAIVCKGILYQLLTWNYWINFKDQCITK